QPLASADDRARDQPPDQRCDGVVDPADGESGGDPGDGEADEGGGPQQPALDVETAGVPPGRPGRGRGGRAGAGAGCAGIAGICGHGVPPRFSLGIQFWNSVSGIQSTAARCERYAVRMETAWRYGWRCGAQLRGAAAAGPSCYTPVSAMVTQRCARALTPVMLEGRDAVEPGAGGRWRGGAGRLGGAVRRGAGARRPVLAGP